MMPALHSAVGLCALLAIAWVLSEDRRRASPRVALVGVVFQLLLGAALLKLPLLNDLFARINDLVLILQSATQAGTSFVLGYLGGAPLPFEETEPGASFILAFRALPLIIVVSALTSLLTYWRVLPLLVRALSAVLERSFAVGGAVALATAANVFVGMIEAPLFIRPYLARLGRGELFVVMCAGMSTIAGTVLLLYATLLGSVLPEAVRHLLVASLISAPAAITIAMLMVPDSAAPPPSRALEGSPDSEAGSAMDAITSGTQRGLQLFLNVTAMLIVLVALVHLVNLLLALAPSVAGQTVTLERLLGYVMAPISWLMGVSWHDAGTAGALLGTKIVLNEFLAYLQLVDLPVDALSGRSRLIMTYALCGFANFGSLGILIGGLATMAPARRAEIVALGPRSIVAGTLASCCTGAVVGIIDAF